MAYINEALIKIYLLEKASDIIGRNRTIEMISSYKTNDNTETQAEE